MAGFWRGDAGEQHSAVSVDFERALTREILLTERLRVKAILATLALLSAFLTLAYEIFPQGIERIWHDQFPALPMFASFLLFGAFELSVLQCYEGEPLLCDMLPYLQSLGFSLAGIEPAWSDPRTQEVFQLDGMFVRTDRR